MAFHSNKATNEAADMFWDTATSHYGRLKGLVRDIDRGKAQPRALSEFLNATDRADLKGQMNKIRWSEIYKEAREYVKEVEES